MQEKFEILYIQLLIYYWLIKLFKLLVSAASEDGILIIGIGLKNLDQSIPKTNKQRIAIKAISERFTVESQLHTIDWSR